MQTAILYGFTALANKIWCLLPPVLCWRPGQMRRWVVVRWR